MPKKMMVGLGKILSAPYADKEYNSDPLGQRLLKGGIELIYPDGKNKQTKKDEDGGKLRPIGVDGRLS